ncbi:YqeG family HAD IIIA-type phosphatase [Anaeropeptidivorans aminofermentans]|jgi:hypothetical protein|uniref:YqeG family HAD IIIA-type phosphatase n=1 Tax=Anaeropeptidivorans aminofermentans TaxID=2934315 RepID=UPI0020259ECF|nr:YqeG family HAD IIIA-type phosphatase [Anaeropeptidivorans aminofermentans]MBE6012291.1 YqeG family HAD IIIA-type phosphatase [Lachnospiraceae bacterium]
MFKIFCPKEYLPDISSVDYKKLYDSGIRYLIYDIDNTIAAYEEHKPGEKALKLFDKLIKMGFKIAFVSNNHKKRVTLFNEDLKFIAIHHGLKPLPFGIWKAMKMIKAKNNNTALIGDQIFTDVLCGNLNNIYTILVKPVSDKDVLSVKIKRGLEKKILERYYKN